MNITNVTITSYSNQSIVTRPKIIPTQIPQSAENKRTFFSILLNIDLKLEEVIAQGGFTNSEILPLSNDMVTFYILRSNTYIDGIDFEREIVDYELAATLFHIIYLQDKIMHISNSVINVTGTVAISSEPLNGLFENVTIDTYGLREGIDFSISCNYPEASLVNEINFNNLKVITSSERTLFSNPSIVFYSGPGNISVSNSDLTGYYCTLNDVRGTIFYIRSGNCQPDDDILQTHTLNNVSTSSPDLDSRQDRFNILVIVTIDNLYRRLKTYAIGLN